MSDKLIQFNHLEVQNTAMAEIMKTMSFNTMIGILFYFNIECICHFCMDCLLAFFINLHHCANLIISSNRQSSVDLLIQ